MARIAIAAAVGVTGVAMPAIADAKKPIKVKVMTRNLYLGAVLDPIIAADSPEEARTAAGEVYKTVIDTNIVARVKLLAQEIENADPDLIGLQEVALWRRGQRGAASDGSTTPAQEVVYDYLELLQDELDRRGLDYNVASRQQEADIEAPISISGDDAAEFDVRLTMRDVILAKDGVRTLNEKSENYEAKLNVPVQGAGTVTVLRGYNAVDVKIRRSRRKRQKFQFVNTHLESFVAATRTNQAKELVAEAGPLSVELPIILLGDLNSDPAGATPAVTNAYNAIVGTETPEDGGFMDLGVEVNTCCFSEGLFDPPPAIFTSRIDHVLGRGAVSEVESTLIGTDPALRTDTGLWPTDHGGVVSKLKVGE